MDRCLKVNPGKLLVTDYKPTHVYVDPWPVRYVSIREISLVMRRNDLWWSRDLAGAYFDGVFGVCLRPATEAIRCVLSLESGPTGVRGNA